MQKEGYIYFIQAGDNGSIKIGYTASDVESRLKTLQTGNPNVLSIIGTIPANKYEEKQTHHYFKHLRLNGEWFKPSDEITKYIKSKNEMSYSRLVEFDGSVLLCPV